MSEPERPAELGFLVDVYNPSMGGAAVYRLAR